MRILLVEDERRVADFVARAFKEDGYEVDLAEEGNEAYRRALQYPYEAIVLDVRLPGLSGLDVCRKLRDARIEAPILMLTARALVEQRVEGFEAGADDYLTKPFAIAELRARIRALVRRGASDRILRCADIEMDRQQRRVTRAGHAIVFTAKEFALLEFLMSRAPDVVSRNEIIERVWDLSFDPHTNLVEVYVNRLRQKLSSQGGPQIIHTLRGAGYCLKVQA